MSKIHDEPVSPNEVLCVIYMMTRNRQMRGGFKIYDEPESIATLRDVFKIYGEPKAPKEAKCAEKCE